jgi:gluconate 2-dehydrogenase gamma chain
MCRSTNMFILQRKEQWMSAEDAITAYLDKKITRREFTDRLRALGVTAGAAFSYAELLTASQAQGRTALEPSEFKVLEAIAGRIFPATDTPGAIEMGAANYIDQALADPYRPQLARYRRGIEELERYCNATLGKSFTVLSAQQKDDILETLAEGKLREIGDGPQFFEMIRHHVMEGVFCEPYYGGNRDLAGWKLVGFPGQRYGYDDPYINRTIDLPPIASNRPPQKGE